MCLSTVYNGSPAPERALLRSVQRIEVEPDGLRCFDILEQDTLLHGRLVSADLVNGRVIVELEEREA